MSFEESDVFMATVLICCAELQAQAVRRSVPVLHAAKAGGR